MATPLLDSLSLEISSFTNAGEVGLQGLLSQCDQSVDELKKLEASLEASLEAEIALELLGGGVLAKDKDSVVKLEKISNNWYKGSISQLKTYNSGINKFLKNVLNNGRFNLNLDECYTYPLNLNNFSTEGSLKSASQNLVHSQVSLVDEGLKVIKQDNQQELIKAIILHLLKIGQCDIVKEMVSDMEPGSGLAIDEALLKKFKLLNEIVSDIVVKHDLSKALEWFKSKNDGSVGSSGGFNVAASSETSGHDEIEFKFHILQFTLLLNGDPNSDGIDVDDALAAYLYSKENFSKFFKDHLHEISPLMTLLLFKTSWDSNSQGSQSNSYFQSYMVNMLQEFMTKMKQTFHSYKCSSNGEYSGSQFVGQILTKFEAIHEDQSIFVNLSNEFISDYCKDLKLSNDSSLFQSILAGFINLPSFYKYNKIQLKLSRASRTSVSHNNETELIAQSAAVASDNVAKDPGNSLDAGYSFDLPFQLPDSNKFLFNFHPIFICPVSKEQLIPITIEDDVREETELNRKRKRILNNPSRENLGLVHNPVVVLKFCQHLALRDSVWQLSKKGTEIFKCHYCYKKHKLSDVSDAYFIDL